LQEYFGPADACCRSSAGRTTASGSPIGAVPVYSAQMVDKSESRADDLWGGLAAMLVALPSAIAFGVATYAALGAPFAAQGAMAGMLGATVLALVASGWGGAPRLITAPCAPAVAVLSALAIELTARGTPPVDTILLLLVTAMLAGAMQVGFGLAGLGRLIKYMPYPVVSGYLSGVGLTIILSQVAKLLGAPASTSWHAALVSPDLWDWRAILIGVTTMGAMALAPRVTRMVPAAILALAAGALAYLALAGAGAAPWQLAGNSLVVGSLGGGGGGFGEALAQRWSALGRLGASELAGLLVPALTLAVLLSIDTLKTCVVLDAMTRSRHDSNRTLVGQGLGNLASAAVGGMAGAGTMGATLVNLSSGGRTRWSGLSEGVLSLLAFVLLGSVLAWVPMGALAGLLMVVGLRMLDRESLHFLASRQTVLDFAVIATVVVVALTVGLIAASGAGILLAIGLFIREQVAGSVVVRRNLGSDRYSKRVRTTAERAILEQQGALTVVFELQGSLFFGTTDQLYSALEPELSLRRFVVLDMRRIQSVDVTAVHMLRQVEDRLAERGARLLFSAVPDKAPSGRDIRRYFREVGLADGDSRVRVFDDVGDALEWIEDQWITQAEIRAAQEAPLELRDMDLFAGRKPETLADLLACMQTRSCRAGERLFCRGDGGDEIYLIRRGTVRILLPLDATRSRHLASFGRGSFFGEMAFLDHQPRSADAVAFTDCELYVLSRQRFDQLVERHKLLGLNLMEGLARLLASRLRHTDAELNALQTS
jgi:SulP family sulfate permease